MPVSLVAAPVCPMCKGGEGAIRHPVTSDRWFGFPGSWTFRGCGTCRGLWLDPRPSEESLPLVYSDYYTHSENAATDARPSRWRRARARLPWHACDRLGGIGYLQGMPPGRVLDVGCGNGARLAHLTRKGWSAVGVDPDERAVTAARRTFDGEVCLGTIHDVKEVAAFDAIALVHVLEHVEDPLDTLVWARTLLRPGGVVSIATPNAESWLHRVYQDRWRGLEPPRHLQIFTADGLRSILEQAGLSQPRAFTTERNAGRMAVESGNFRAPTSITQHAGLLLKSELVQAIEWARLRWSPLSGEELVGSGRRE